MKVTHSSWFTSSLDEAKRVGCLLIMDDQSSLCELPAECIHDAAVLAANAMVDNSIYVTMCHGPNYDGKNNNNNDNDDRMFRKQFLTWLFERNFRLRLGTSVNRAVFENSSSDDGKKKKLLAFFMFVSPDVPNVGLLDMLREGFLLVPIKFGFGVMKRLLSIKDEYERIEHAVMDKHGITSLYKLERMVVHPSYQGKGVGSKALQQALDEADTKGLPVLLGTQEERNLRFYNKLGFEVVDTANLCGCTHWSMLRQPQISEDKG